MITVFHTADIHFGVENYGRVDPKTGIHTRLLDFEKSLAVCIDDAIEQDIDLFLFAGDAYKTAHPTPTQQKLFIGQLLRLYKANIQTVIIVGNHDHPLSFGKANALDIFKQLPVDGFHVFSKPGLRRITTKRGVVQVVGMPWPTRNTVVANQEHHLKNSDEITRYISKRVGEIINHFAEKVNPNEPAILSAHLTVSNGIFSGSEKRALLGRDPVFLPSELALPVFDYVALGHLHRYQSLNGEGYPSVVYSGSIDRVDFGERKETKGYCKVVIDVDGKPTVGKNQYTTCATHEFVPLATRPFVQIEVNLNAEGDQTQQLCKAITKHVIENAIIKIIYHVPEGRKDTVDLHVLERACAAAHYIVGIIPVHVPIRREQRALVKGNMGLVALLDTYLEGRDDLKDHKDRLREKALLLHNEIESHEHSGTGG